MWEREWSNWIRQKILSWKAKDFERKPLVCTPSPGSARLAPITNVDAQCRASQSSSVEKCERICFGLIWLLVPGCLHLPHPPFYNKSNLLNVFLTESLSTKNRHYGMMQVPLCNKSNLNVFMTEKKNMRLQNCPSQFHLGHGHDLLLQLPQVFVSLCFGKKRYAQLISLQHLLPSTPLPSRSPEPGLEYIRIYRVFYNYWCPPKLQEYLILSFLPRLSKTSEVVLRIWMRWEGGIMCPQTILLFLNVASAAVLCYSVLWISLLLMAPLVQYMHVVMQFMISSGPRDAQKLSLRLALTIHKSSVATFFLFLSGRFYHHRQENAILNRANVQLMSGVCN